MTLETTNRPNTPNTSAPFTDPFAMEMQEYRTIGNQLVEMAVTYFQELASSPVYQPMPEEVRDFLRDLPLPNKGRHPEDILSFVERYILPWQRQQNHPRFSAFVDPGVAPLATEMMFLAAIMNNSGSGGHYSLIYLEQTVVRWLAELIGFPLGDGILLGGGSASNRAGLEVARYWGAKKYGWDVREEGLAGHPPLIVYGTGERHSCIDKAAFTLGLGTPHTIPHDDRFGMQVRALENAISADRQAGFLPLCVVATAGTVTTGAIDPLEAIAAVCEREGLWLHVDGAFGGLGAADPALRRLYYPGLERANSVALDLHKWGATPIGNSSLILNATPQEQRELLVQTYKLVPSYLDFSNGRGFAGDYWYSHRGDEQTRPTFRALTAFSNLLQAGREGFAALVRRHVALADLLRVMITDTPDLEVVAGGPLPVVCFRAVPAVLRHDEGALRTFNRIVMEKIQVEGRVFLGGVEVAGNPTIYALRYCNLNHALSEDDIEAVVRETQRVAQLCLPDFLRRG